MGARTPHLDMQENATLNELRVPKCQIEISSEEVSYTPDGFVRRGVLQRPGQGPVPVAVRDLKPPADSRRLSEAVRSPKS